MLDHGALVPRIRLPSWLGPRWLFLAIWSFVGAVALTQRWLDRALAGSINDLRVVALDAVLIVLWAAASPAIVIAARRYPLLGTSIARHSVLHLAAAVGFIVATNVLIRVPMLWSPGMSLARFADDLGLGLVRFGPMALLVYAAIVAVGHLIHRTDRVAYPERITVREWNRAHLVRAADVEWIEADDNYVIVQVGGRVLKGRGRISDLETRLDPARFVRIHRSAIVARERVREVRPLAKGDLAVVMNDGKQLRVARTRRAALERGL